MNTYNPPQYALDHLASLKVGDKAVLLEPILNTKIPSVGLAWDGGWFYPDKDGDYTKQLFTSLPEGSQHTLPNGVKVKVLSVEPVRCRYIGSDLWQMAGKYCRWGEPWYEALEHIDDTHPGAWERNDWFWVAEVEVKENPRS